MSHKVPSAVHLTRRGLITFALVWQGLWMLSDSGLWPTNQSTVIESLLILGTWILWVLILALLVTWTPGDWHERWITRLTRANLLLLAASAVAISIISIDPRIDDWLVSASIFNLVIGLAGIVVYRPRQWAWVGGLFFIELVVFAGFGFSYASEMTLVSVILYPLYALAIGIAAATVQRGLMTGATQYDSMRDAVIEQQTLAQQIQNTERDVALMQSRVHESVLNTLTAISRGGLPDTPEFENLIRHKASESAEVLNEIAHLSASQSQTNWSGLSESVSDLVWELTARGIKVKVEGDLGSHPPEQVKAAFIAAVRESLINVLRHSQASEVSIRVNRRNNDSFTVTIEDNGVGFSDGRIGFGLGAILSTQLDEIGASAKIHSVVNQGTTVVIDYSNASLMSRYLKSLTWKFKQSSFNFVAPIMISWLLFSLASILFTWNDYESQFINIAAFTVLAGLSFWTIWVSRSGGIPWWLVLVGVLAAYVGYQLEYLALGGETGGTWTEWSSELIVALFFVFAVAGPWWAWVMLGTAWVYIQGNFPMEFIAPGFAMLMTGAFLGWTLRRNSRRLARSVREASDSASYASIAEVQSRIRFERFAFLDPVSTINLLQDISNGTFDWRDQQTQRLCAVHETYVRNVVMGQASHVIELISEFAVLARDRGIVLETTVTDSGDILHIDHMMIGQIKKIIEEMGDFDSGRLTISQENGNTIFRLVGQISHFSKMPLGDLIAIGSFDYDFEQDTERAESPTFIWQASSEEFSR